MNKAAKAIPIIIALILAFAIGGVVYAEGPDSAPPAEPGVTLTVGGVSQSVRVGQVVYTPEGGAPGASGDSDAPVVCDTPPMTIRIEGSSGISGVTVSTDEDCVVSVTEIRRSPAEEGCATAAGGPQEKRYRGWAKSELSDFAGFDLAAIRAKIDYFDNGESVYGGREPFAHCNAWEYIGGWAVETCGWYM